MIYYLDDDFRVHVKNEPGLTPWEDTESRFAGKCNAYIEGFRVVPEGENYLTPDGVTLTGPNMAPAVDIQMLLLAQAAYEQGSAMDDIQTAAILDLEFRQIVMEMGWVL